MLRHINPHLSKLKVSRCHCFCAGPFGCPPTTLALLEHRSPGSGVFQCLIFSGAPCSRHWRWGFFPQDASDASSPHPGLQTGMAEEGMRIFCEVANLA